MSKISNKRIAEVLRQAVPHLAQNESEILVGGKEDCVCFAILKGAGYNWYSDGNAGTRAIRKIIEKSLGGYGTVVGWLRGESNVSEDELTTDNIQAYRHAWVQAMIKEFSK